MIPADKPAVLAMFSNWETSKDKEAAKKKIKEKEAKKDKHQGQICVNAGCDLV